MFRKAFKVKTSSQLKGSDRKRFRSALERCFPPVVEASAFPLTSKEELVTQAKVVCHGGEIVQMYSINGDPVAFEYMSKWYLTLYGVWKAPSALPALLTWGPVVQKLANGADLMGPGIVIRDENRDIYAALNKGDVVQIRIVGCSHAVAVGVMLMSGQELVASQKGKAAQVLHMYRDYLWKMGSKKKIDFEADQSDEADKSADEEDETLKADESPEDSHVEGDNARVENEPSSNCEPDESEQQGDDAKLEQALEEMRLDDDPRSAQNRMDYLLKECFLSALKTSYKQIQLPILTSIFYSNYVMACAPDGQAVEVKKSSYKKVSKFFAEMQALGYIEIKEERKGVEQVTGINEELISSFRVQPEFRPKAKETTSSGETAAYHPPEIRQIFLVTAEVLPIFKGYKKGSPITLEEIRSHIKQYVQDNELQTEDKRIVRLEPVLAHVVLAKKEFDTQVSWETLNRRVLSKFSSAYEIRVPNQEPIIKKGAIDPITISVATRCGNKKVTFVHGFETFGIDASNFAHQVQLGVSASTTVTPLAHNKDWQQVLIQGNQVNFVAKLLFETYKIPRNYVRGLEHAPKKKGK